MRHITVVALLLLLFAPMSWGATCKITEYRVLGLDSNGRPLNAGPEPPVTTQTVTHEPLLVLEGNFVAGNCL